MAKNIRKIVFNPFTQKFDYVNRFGPIYSVMFNHDGGSANVWMDLGGGGSMSSDQNPYIVPFRSRLRGITFTNEDNNVDTQVQIRKLNAGDTNTGNEASVFNWSLSNVRVARKSNFASPVIFEPGDKVAIALVDIGDNPSDVVVRLYLEILEYVEEESSENFNGDF